MRCSIGRQCSSCNTGDICSCLGVSATILAATFWTRWSLLMVCFGSPYGGELQKSNLEVMKACTSISAVGRLIYFLVRLMFRRWQKPALHTAVTWCSIDREESYRTPMFLAGDDMLMTSSQSEIDVRGEGGRCLAFKTTISVLSLFILSMLTVIQLSISRTQSSIANFARLAEDDSKVRHDCVSSAHKWKLTSWCLIISPKGEVYKQE